MQDERNRIVENEDRPRGRKLYQRKGWKGFVHSYKEVTRNGNWEKIKWGTGPKPTEKDENDFRKLYKFD